jgi:hypothetical protein
MIIQIFNGSQKGVRFDFEIVLYDPENTVFNLSKKFRL